MEDEKSHVAVARSEKNGEWFLPGIDVEEILENARRDAERAIKDWLEAERKEREAKTPPGGVWMKFETWAPNSLHWYEPSDITVWPDGKVIVHVRTLSNQRVTNPLGNGGRDWSFWINFSTYNTIEDAQASRNRLTLHEFHLATLSFKEERHFMELEFFDPRIGAAIAACGAYSFERQIMKHHSGGGGQVLLPIISRPWNP